MERLKQFSASRAAEHSDSIGVRGRKAIGLLSTVLVGCEQRRCGGRVWMGREERRAGKWGGREAAIWGEARLSPLCHVPQLCHSILLVLSSCEAPVPFHRWRNSDSGRPWDFPKVIPSGKARVLPPGAPAPEHLLFLEWGGLDAPFCKILLEPHSPDRRQCIPA